MATLTFLRKWRWLLLAAALLAAGALGWARSQAGRQAAVEVVTIQPMRAVAAQDSAMTAEARMLNEAEAGQPRVSLPGDFFDFGAIASQAVVRHDFLLINQGSSPLLIWNAYTTCGCTTAEVSATVIPPGKASRATVIFDAGFHAMGGQTVRRGVILETNDPEHPQVEIWVQAAVER